MNKTKPSCYDLNLTLLLLCLAVILQAFPARSAGFTPHTQHRSTAGHTLNQNPTGWETTGRTDVEK